MPIAAKIHDSDIRKIVKSDKYNYIFNKKSGLFIRWGEEADDDPEYSPLGPEILDVEISSGGCESGKRAGCKFCYKTNISREVHHMTLPEFIHVLDIMKPNLTQVAFGITSVEANPDFYAMCEYCREKGVVPNFTLSGMDPIWETPEKLQPFIDITGSMAVSAYASDTNPEQLKQCLEQAFSLSSNKRNTYIHFMLSEETVTYIPEIVDFYATKPKENSPILVLLGIKPRGMGKNFHPVTQETFDNITNLIMDKNILLGMDSCTHPKFEAWVLKYKPEIADHILIHSEPCESGIFSFYVDSSSKAWPCSFCEGLSAQWDLTKVSDYNEFLSKVWHGKDLVVFRDTLKITNRSCPMFNLTGE
jgi:MoaA/NifB/PqqE/SkfB family radical SAM enzyme